MTELKTKQCELGLKFAATVLAIAGALFAYFQWKEKADQGLAQEKQFQQQRQEQEKQRQEQEKQFHRQLIENREKDHKVIYYQRQIDVLMELSDAMTRIAQAPKKLDGEAISLFYR